MSHVLRVGVADQIAYFRAYNTDGSANTSLTASTTGLTLSVFRVGLLSTSILTLSNKAADNTAHSDGAIRQVSGNLYTVDLPDAACSVQCPSICVRGSYTGGVIEGLEHPIVAYDPSVVAVGANTTTPPTAEANATAVESQLANEFNTINTNLAAVGLAVVDRPTLTQIEASTVLAKESNATNNKNEILTAVGNIEIDNAAIASAVRVELTDELEIINNIPASFDFISEQIDGIQTVVYVSPAYMTVPMSIKAKTIRPFYKDMSRLGPIGYFDSTKTPIDLATFDGDMYIVVEDKETNTVLLYNEDPTYVEHNLYIDPSQESVESSSNNICWALRLISNDKVLMEGPWEIQNAAYGTSP